MYSDNSYEENNIIFNLYKILCDNISLCDNFLTKFTWIKWFIYNVYFYLNDTNRISNNETIHKVGNSWQAQSLLRKTWVCFTKNIDYNTEGSTRTRVGQVNNKQIKGDWLEWKEQETKVVLEWKEVEIRNWTLLLQIKGNIRSQTHCWIYEVKITHTMLHCFLLIYNFVSSGWIIRLFLTTSYILIKISTDLCFQLT